MVIRRKRWIILLATLIALMIVACDVETPPIVVTATPIEEPTPTQEVIIDTPAPETPEWSVECLDAGQIPENPDPCLGSPMATAIFDGEQVQYPSAWSVFFDKNPDSIQGELEYTNITYYDGGYTVNMHYWQGYAGFGFAPFYPEAGLCYVAIIDGEWNGNANYQQSADNYYTFVEVHFDDGRPPVTLGQFRLVEDYNQPWSSLSGEIHHIYPFYTQRDGETWLIQAGVRSVWGIGGDGTWFRFYAIRFVQVDPGHCAGYAGI